VFLELAKKHYSAHFNKTNAEKEEDVSMGIIEGSLYGRRLQHWFKAVVGLQTLQWTRPTKRMERITQFQRSSIKRRRKDHATGGHPPLRIANLQRIDILCTKTIDNEHENGTTSYRHLSTTYYETKSYINLQHCQLVILL